jgi:hypothetical protein
MASLKPILGGFAWTTRGHVRRIMPGKYRCTKRRRFKIQGYLLPDYSPVLNAYQPSYTDIQIHEYQMALGKEIKGMLHLLNKV